MWQLIKKEYLANSTAQLINLGVLGLMSTIFGMLWLNEIGNSDPVEAQFDLATGIYAIIVFSSTRINSILFFMIDEVYNPDIVFASLPVKRIQIVLAKYVASLAQIVFGISTHVAIILLVTHFMVGLDHIAIEFITSTEIWIVLVVLIILFNSFSFPFYLRFGLKNAVPIVLVTQFLVFAAAFLLYKFFNLEDPIQDWLNWVGTLPSALILGSIATFSLAVLAVSIATSIKIYNNKEL